MTIVLIFPKNDVIEWAICCVFKTTNNEVEYEALIASFSLATHKVLKNGRGVRAEAHLGGGGAENRT